MGYGKYSDGKSIPAIAPSGGVLANRLYRIDGWNGVPTKDAAGGEGFALQVDPTALVFIEVPSGLTVGTRGMVLYIPAATSGDATNALTATATDNVPAVKVEQIKDAANLVGVRILNVG